MLETALRVLPLATTSPDYDVWARRWLSRRLAEREPSMEAAAEVAATLADLPAEPAGFEGLW